MTRQMPPDLPKSSFNKALNAFLGVSGVLFAMGFLVRGNGYQGILLLLREIDLWLLSTAIVLIVVSKFVQALSWLVFLRHSGVENVSRRNVFHAYNAVYAFALVSPIHSIAPTMILFMKGILGVSLSIVTSCWVVTTYMSLVASAALGFVMSVLAPAIFFHAIPSNSGLWFTLIMLIGTLGFCLHFVVSRMIPKLDARQRHQVKAVALLQQMLVVVGTVDLKTLMKIAFLNSFIAWGIQSLAVSLALRSMGVPSLTLVEVLIIWAMASMAGRIAPGLISIGTEQLAWTMFLDRFTKSTVDPIAIGALLPLVLVYGPTLVLGSLSSIALMSFGSSEVNSQKSDMGGV